MQHDEVIWQVINQHHCSFKTKCEGQNFCRNRYNVTGLCNRSSCPLANSRYATVNERQGQVFLYMKTIERAHTPKNMWERVKLSKNYAEAIKQIDKHLEFWPNFLRHKCKQRLTKITQYLIRMRKLKLKTRPITVRINKKVERRERKREEKAKVAARLTGSIKKELLERLHSNVYQDIVNVPSKEYEEVLDEHAESENELESEDEEDIASGVEYVEDSDIESEDDIEDIKDLEYEYEYEMEGGGSVAAPSSSSASSSSARKRSRFQSEGDSDGEDNSDGFGDDDSGDAFSDADGSGDSRAAASSSSPEQPTAKRRKQVAIGYD